MTDDQLHADEIKQSINDPDIIEEILVLLGINSHHNNNYNNINNILQQ